MQKEQLKQALSDIMLDNFKFGEYGNGVKSLAKLCKTSRTTINKMIDAEYNGLNIACNVLEALGYELTIICKGDKHEQIQSKEI